MPRAAQGGWFGRVLGRSAVAASRAVGWPAVPPAVPDLRSLLEALEQARLRSFSEGPQVVTIVTGWPAG